MKAFFDSWDEKHKKPFGAVKTSSQVSLFIETQGVQSCQIRIWDDVDGESVLPMRKTDHGFYADFRTYETGRLLWYHFILTGDDGSVCYYGNNPDKLGGEGRLSFELPKDYQITVYCDQKNPQWFSQGVLYQIFPDRFAKDAKAEDRAKSIGIKLVDWSVPPSYEKNKAGDVVRWDFYGGSLEGIRQNLLYLRSLGVTVIYLNPIFKAKSNHRYDTMDFMEIDPLLGTEQDFVRLCKEAGENGIRIILDGVFSHVGVDSIYFKNARDEHSKYHDWFKFDNSEIGYRAWWGVKDLPEINEMNPSYVEFICGKDGVIEHWIKAGASGFRLDVADELPDEFIRLIRKAVKRCGDDKVLIGEVWEDASNKESYGEKRRYLMGDELDSVMNYPLRKYALDFVMGRIPGSEFQKRFMSLNENYPREIFYSLFNLLGTHDTKRLINEVEGSREKVKMLFTLAFALPGVPAIYYGDELAMRGGTDPENRACMNWSPTADYDMHYSVRMLKVIYNDHLVLKDSEYKAVFSDDPDIFACERRSNDERILLIANRNETQSKKFKFTTSCRYALDLVKSREYIGDGQSVTIDVPPAYTALVLLKRLAPHLELPFGSERKAGVIAPIFSIPGGKLGKPARDFIDWLSACGISLWQVLPIHPVGMGGSPYLSPDVFKCNADFLNNEEIPRSLRKASVEEIFFAQWADLREYAHSKGISIIGDIPIYVDPKGADVRRNPECFQLDGEGRMRVRAGVPPDYFQQDGQDWGNPLYDWNRMVDDGYDWWMRRIEMCSKLFDYVRLDHFRSFSEYYAIPEGKSPKEGKWLTGPGLDFFRRAKARFPGVKFIAEDLGCLDDAVFNLLKLTGIPGMNVWQFSADEMERMKGDRCANRIFYSGTHDNSTLLSWCGGDRARCEDIIKRLCASDAPWVVFQLQDLLFLDDSARINVPGTMDGNWKWRCEPGRLTQAASAWVREMLGKHGRLARNCNR
ncbi:MAG TPA: hypothetical protein DCO86_01190 [Spirochaetaceae bacterium]|nr:hypothetical protein [Spirochaetaceae bacterium]